MPAHAPDPFAQLLGHGRGTLQLRAQQLVGRTLTVAVAPQRPVRERYQTTPDGQTFTALLMRTDETDDEGRAWKGAPAVAFYAPDACGELGPYVRVIGSATLLASSSSDGLFPLDSERPSFHYLDRETFQQVCDWLLSQPDSDLLAR